jgi:deazaflavin-dependent oxidoreductase (nitroreductase family)
VALHHNRFVRGFVGLFLKAALTAPGRWLFSNYSARLDPIIYRWTGGRLNSTGPLLFPVLALTTTGRKSGKKRSVQLAYVAFEGDAYVVASNFGKERHPGWMHNIEADPNVSVQLGSNHHAVTAHKLTEVEKDACGLGSSPKSPTSTPTKIGAAATSGCSGFRFPASKTRRRPTAEPAVTPAPRPATRCRR